MGTDRNHSIKTGIFGGTFDPVHKGHVSIVEAFLESGILDELWVLPTPRPPFKDDILITPFEHRFNMADIAFDNHSCVAVSDIESMLTGTSYTINTLSFLSEHYPEREWYLCIGGDNFVDFHKWKDYRGILEIARLLVAHRPGAQTGGIDKKILERTHFVEHQPVDISSTEIRKCLKAGESHPDVPREVLEYIQRNGLYQN